MWVRAIAGVLAAVTCACAHKEIPLNLAAIPQRKVPVHKKIVALLPLVDARTAADGSDDAAGFDYRGVEYAHTALRELSGEPIHHLTRLLAQRLVHAGIFAQVILVLSPDQAPEADLILKAKLRRMRGYVEAAPPDKKTGRPQDERFVLAEVFLEDIELSDPKQPSTIYFRSDAGWSIDEKRTVPQDVERDPWPLLGEAFQRAITDLTRELERADFSGRYVVKEQVALAVDAPEDAADAEGAAKSPFGALAESAPAGWALVKTSSASKVIGWRSSGEGCRQLRFQQQHTVRFSRTLGPYRPSVIVWTCSKDQRLSYNPLEEFPARYLGTRADGSAIFLRTLGESNWPNVLQELKGHLAITPPRARHVFEVGGAPPG